MLREQRHLVRMPSPGLFDDLGARLWRAVRQKAYASRFYDWRLRGRHPLKLLGCPVDPFPGDATAGAALHEGVLIAHGGRQGARLGIEQPDFCRRAARSPALSHKALGFSWLADLAMIKDQKRARVVAELLMRGWLDAFGRYHSEAWSAPLLAERLRHWLIHAPLILSSHDLVYRSAVLNSMARQARHLMRVLGDSADGLPRVHAASGLILCGLYLPHGKAWRLRGEAALRRVLDRFVLADGGPISRMPEDLLAVMKLLVILRHGYDDRQEESPAYLQQCLDRMGPFLRALRHADGRLTHINGAGGEPPELIDLVLAQSAAHGRALSNAPYTGLMRLNARQTLVIFDAMPAAPMAMSHGAHAGTLSFELADGPDPLVVNIGPVARAPLSHKSADQGGDERTDPYAADLAALVRTTAAHSTLILMDKNSTRIRNDHLGEGVSHIELERVEQPDALSITARHDGYRRRLKVDHQRRLSLSRRGDRLDGTDLCVAHGRLPRAGLPFHIRFHLHPAVSASITQGGRAVLLRLSHRHGWLFHLNPADLAAADLAAADLAVDDLDAELILEESVYMEAGRPVRCQQIVITGRFGGQGVAKGAAGRPVHWRFERLSAARPPSDKSLTPPDPTLSSRP
jgi:uncharacterized heparinase superfamily protein